VVWVFSDQYPFGGDQSQYAKDTVSLTFTLFQTPKSWVSVMLHAVGNKGPGIAWAGQFFVPLGLFIGSVDKALLLQIVTMQGISLVLVFYAIYT